jgi:hypothetical protein
MCGVESLQVLLMMMNVWQPSMASAVLNLLHTSGNQYTREDNSCAQRGDRMWVAVEEAVVGEIRVSSVKLFTASYQAVLVLQ